MEVLNKSHFSLQMGNCPIPIRGGGTYSKLGAQPLNRGQNLDAQNQPFPSLRLKYWVRKYAPLRIRLHRPCLPHFIESIQHVVKTQN